MSDLGEGTRTTLPTRQELWDWSTKYDDPLIMAFLYAARARDSHGDEFPVDLGALILEMTKRNKEMRERFSRLLSTTVAPTIIVASPSKQEEG